MGGEGSGNFNHEGRPGLVGGSGEGGAGATPTHGVPQRVHEFAAKNTGSSRESSVWVDSNGDVVGSKDGGKNSIGFTPEELSQMFATTLVHNHPNGASFSPEDVEFMFRNGLNGIVATTDKYIYEAEPKYVEMVTDPRHILGTFWLEEGRTRRKYEVQAFRQPERTNDIWAEHTNEIWENIAKDVGIDYRRRSRG